MTFERDNSGRTWTINGKLWGDMTDREVEVEASHWATESKFYNRAAGEFGQQLRDLYQTNDRMRYYNYIAQKELWNRTHKDVVRDNSIRRKLIEYGGDSQGMIPLQKVFDILDGK